MAFSFGLWSHQYILLSKMEKHYMFSSHIYIEIYDKLYTLQKQQLTQLVNMV